jgi:pyruvyltransferase
MKFKFPWNKPKSDNQVYLSYDNHQNNFGDILSPIIANHFGSKEVIRISKKRSRKHIHYYMVGSILQRCNSNTVIWGSGFISANSICKEIPKKVLAVRGPLTRDRLINLGIECPEIYGDPALLLPEIYPVVNRNVKYKLGIIPHFRDKNNPWLKRHFSQSMEIKIIDIQNKNPLKVVDDMLKCEKIISSSLHGIIIADAYEIPAVWFELSDKVEGAGFKFADYYKSVGRVVCPAFQFDEFRSLDEILNVFEPYELNIDVAGLKNVFPF